MKKFISTLLATLMLVMLLAGCAGDAQNDNADNSSDGENQSAENWPNSKTINWQISGTAGSSGDTLVRALIQELEPLMGVTIVPNNDYWAPSTELLMESAPDGNTLGNVPTPNILTSLVKTKSNDDPSYKDVAIICGFASSDICVGVHPDDERFKDVNTLADFVKWCEQNADENLLVGIKSESSQDNVAYCKMMEATGIDANVVTKVNSANAAELMSSFLGNNVDVMISSVAEMINTYREGNVKIISVFAEDRNEFIPDVETAIESGYDIVDKLSFGLTMNKETPQEIQDKYYSYLEQAVASEDFQQTMKDVGYSLDFVPGDEYVAYLDEQVVALTEMREMLGWE